MPLAHDVPLENLPHDIRRMPTGVERDIAAERWLSSAFAVASDTSYDFHPSLSPRVDTPDGRLHALFKPTSALPEGTTELVFDQGRKDNWAAVVRTRTPDGRYLDTYATDAYYMSRIALLAARHGCDQVERDCLVIFHNTTDVPELSVLATSNTLSHAYSEDENLAYDLFLHIYFGMIAEEHFIVYRPELNLIITTRVGKSIKMLALDRILKQGIRIEAAVTECCGANPVSIRTQADAARIFRIPPKDPYKTPWDIVIDDGSHVQDHLVRYMSSPTV